MTIVATAIRYFFEAIFCYLLYKNSNRFIFKIKNTKKLLIFCGVYTSTLLLYKFLFIPKQFDPTTRFVATFVIFAYFWLKNRKIKEFSYVLTFSIFVSLMTECSYFTGYAANRFFWKSLDMYDSIKITNLLLCHCIILVLHFFILLVVYKFRFIKMKDIKNLSIHKEIPIIFSLCLSTIIYIKYNYQLANNDHTRSVFMWVLIFLLPTYLGFYQAFVKLAKLINSNKNYVADKNIFDWILHPPSKTKFIINAGGDSLAFLDKYEYVTLGFIKKLNVLGINNGCKGYSSLVFSLFLTSMLRGTKDWNFEDNVFHMADKLLKSPIKGTVRYDIENIIKKIWLLEEYETLKSEYYNFCFLKNHNKGYSAPSVEEFLTNMSSNNRITLKEIVSSERSSKPFARHGELVNIHGEGVLITGSSGVGKSDAVLELLKEGHCLIADDLVELRRMNNSIYGNACQESRNFMESRGIGIINVKRTIGAGAVREVERIDLVINLISLEDCKNLILMDDGKDENKTYAPLGQAQNWVEISGVRIPYINILVQQGRNIANLIEIAALNNRQRFFGFVAENELFENLGMEGNETKSKVISEKELWSY